MRSISDDAVQFHNCPRCGQLAGNKCRQPSGRKHWPPHMDRESLVVIEDAHKILRSPSPILTMQANTTNSNPTHHVVHNYSNDCEEFERECWPKGEVDLA